VASRFLGCISGPGLSLMLLGAGVEGTGGAFESLGSGHSGPRAEPQVQGPASAWSVLWLQASLHTTCFQRRSRTWCPMGTASTASTALT